MSNDRTAETRRRFALDIVRFLGHGDPEQGKTTLKRILDDATHHVPALNLVGPDGEWIIGESTHDRASDCGLAHRTPAVYSRDGKVAQESIRYINLAEIGNEVGITASRPPERGFGW